MNHTQATADGQIGFMVFLSFTDFILFIFLLCVTYQMSLIIQFNVWCMIEKDESKEGK